MEEQLLKIKKQVLYIIDWMYDIQEYLNNIQKAIKEIEKLKNNEK